MSKISVEGKIKKSDTANLNKIKDQIIKEFDRTIPGTRKYIILQIMKIKRSKPNGILRDHFVFAKSFNKNTF
jgi:hypothetical protein